MATTISAKIRKAIKENGTPLLVLSPSIIKRNFKELKRSLPMVDLYYAMKANPHEAILKAVLELGGGFDIATVGEMNILDSLGANTSRMIYSHPIKEIRDIENAVKRGIPLTIFDNHAEIDKLAAYKDKIDTLLRISIENPDCIVNLGYKFGAMVNDAIPLLLYAKEKGLSVRGIAFHVGSQNLNSYRYIEALDIVRALARMAAAEGIRLDILDIGGGFPISYITQVTPIFNYCAPIREHLDKYFSGWNVIAEPGRFISGSAVTLAAGIIGKAVRHGINWYYINDSIYGSFSGKMFDHCTYEVITQKEGDMFLSVIAGHTCDSIDVLYENLSLPELKIGDTIFFPGMGAYTSASASANFNGYSPTPIYVLKE